MLRKLLIASGFLIAGTLCAQLPAPGMVAPLRSEITPADYGQRANWVCGPSAAAIVCSSQLDALRIESNGARVSVPHVIAKDPPIDCFYVYPTTSSDPTYYSDLVLDADEQRAIHGQAARLTARCRLFVPVYHQQTVAALAWGMAHPLQAVGFDVPYRDIRAAWRWYLAHANQGRGVIFVGHSQGAILLKRLIQDEIDGRPAQRQSLPPFSRATRT